MKGFPGCDIVDAADWVAAAVTAAGAFPIVTRAAGLRNGDKLKGE
jgi:hypothetical protein